MTPLLPVREAGRFAEALSATGADGFIIQSFQKAKGRFVAGTRGPALRLFQKYRWDDHAYQKVFHAIKARIPTIGEGKEGFAPPV